MDPKCEQQQLGIQQSANFTPEHSLSLSFFQRPGIAQDCRLFRGSAQLGCVTFSNPEWLGCVIFSDLIQLGCVSFSGPAQLGCVMFSEPTSIWVRESSLPSRGQHGERRVQHHPPVGRKVLPALFEPAGRRKSFVSTRPNLVPAFHSTASSFLKSFKQGRPIIFSYRGANAKLNAVAEEKLLLTIHVSSVLSSRLTTEETTVAQPYAAINNIGDAEPF